MASVLDAGAAVVFFVALLSISPAIALAVAALAGVHTILVLVTRTLRERVMTEFLAAEAACQSRQIELISAIESIKSMGRERAMLQRWSGPFVTMLDVQRRQGNLEAVMSGLAPVVVMLVSAAVIVLFPTPPLPEPTANSVRTPDRLRSMLAWLAWTCATRKAMPRTPRIACDRAS